MASILLWYYWVMDKIKLINNFVDDETCDHMVKVYDNIFLNVNKYKDGRKMIHNKTFPEISEFLKVYVDKLSQEFGIQYYVRDLLLSIYEEGAFVEPHTDYMNESVRDSLGVLFYFNDNFTGGEVYFTNFDYEYHPQKGSVLIFPCNNPQYKHGVKPVLSGIRYTMPLEVTHKKELKVISL